MSKKDVDKRIFKDPRKQQSSREDTPVREELKNIVQEIDEDA